MKYKPGDLFSINVSRHGFLPYMWFDERDVDAHDFIVELSVGDVCVFVSKKRNNELIVICNRNLGIIHHKHLKKIDEI
jgi:hypothetical protein